MIRGSSSTPAEYRVSHRAAQELRIVHASLRLMALLAQPTTPQPKDLVLSRAQLAACFKSLGDSVRVAMDGITPVSAMSPSSDGPASAPNVPK